MQSGKSPESFTFTVGKLDAGMAILLGERAHLIEFPSILLPPGATTGSIVNIAVHQNHAEEKRRDTEFWDLQDDILKEFGIASPEPPNLQLRNTTQTSVTLEWSAVKLATSKLRSLDIYRNGQRLAAIPNPLTNTSTKLSGLELNTEYTFQLVLRTTGGTFPSNLLRVRTHTMTDTSGISVCFGNVQDEVLLENAKMALRAMKAKWSDTIQIDTTHFVCTAPAVTEEGAKAVRNDAVVPGREYQRALQLSIPIVQPHWILACHTEKKMVPIAAYYLGVNPTPLASAGFNQRPQSMSQASLPHTPTSPSPVNNRASMPPPARTPPGNASTFVGQPQPASASRPPPQFEPTPEEGDDTEEVQLERTTSNESKRKSRAGTMNKDFRFPSPATSPTIPDKDPMTKVPPAPLDEDKLKQGPLDDKPASVITPSSIEVPPPPPVEKERRSVSASSGDEDGEDDVGDTVEVDLN
ncbi:hypothetical protein BDQ12DRAFT_623298 [Crucibulum laeve]|uniref:Fibronectin type III/BRCA1 domain-containing protein n=1 Tax=Crucibulum laeve TaxID=68775 RepID=A0A5C3MH50_9AGAR|nr:hypothetical protein BDQ12DRAFT_623298 [Crucibulum laeve]